VASELGIDGREAYVAIYWILLGSNYGPKASSIMAEIDKDAFRHMINEIT